MTAEQPAPMTLPTDAEPRPAAVAAAGARVNLFGLDRAALRAEFEKMGESGYRADQIMLWIYRRGVVDFALMSNVGKALRARLEQHFVIRPPDWSPSRSRPMAPASGC